MSRGIDSTRGLLLSEFLYWRLINGVAMWDAAVERQVELVGPDAGWLTQIRKRLGKRVVDLVIV